MSQKISPTMLKLSKYISAATSKPIPKQVSERAKLHLIDTFSAMISGSRLEPGKKAIAYVKTLGGKPEATVIGTKIRTSMQNAALANGMFGHADETDDTHPPSLTHPGTSVVPSALAVSETRKLSGEEFLRAVVLGYDICARTLLTLKPMPYLRSGHHAGATGQVFGASAAAGALLKLSPLEVRYMLSYTGQQTAGLYTMFRDPEHIEKAYAMGGMPAHNGLQSALMVKSGWTGVEDIFSGERNFFYTFAPEDYEINDLVDGLGKRFEMMRASIKRWPIGGPIQGPMHVLNDLLKEHQFKAADIEKIIAKMPDKELEIVNNRPMPDISVQHLLSVMVIDNKLTFKSAHDFARMKDPQILKMRSKVHAVGDESLTDVQRRWRCVMEVHLKNGTVLHGQTMAAKGSFENPLNINEEKEKAMDLIGPILGKPRSIELLDYLWNIDQVKNMASIQKFITK
ncbi:MmgE/PrpD family protein [Polynucleobacter rarus]|uniref:MmgE/PrpD family protein n=1 Tax=Polynucleobacter rarus TaxID=556055 RepID=UPI000D3E4610|nr:MmgE/PrpD family protein [Polynucleobacter rarus]